MVVRLSSIRSYGIAVLALATATGMKLALGDTLGADAPFALFGLAIIASGALGGPRSAFFASVLGALVDRYYFMSPYESFAVADSGTLVRVFALLFEGVAISAIVTRVDSARRAAEQTASRLSRLQSLTSALASAVTPFDVAERTVRNAVDALGAATGIFIQPGADGALEILAHCGIDAGLISAFKPDADYPVVLAFRQGQPQWVESAAEFTRSYARRCR
jgi:K+-sensing histidine kinase KdpD